MSDLKQYFLLFAKVKSDPYLSAMIQEYESTAKQLNELLADPDYDAAEAIRLTNDAEYLSAVIEQNALYQQFSTARAAVANSLNERAAHFSGCNCALCQNKCAARRTYEENA